MAFDKKTKVWSRAAIKKVAQEADFYDAETEEALARLVEDDGHRALGIVRGGHELSGEGRPALALYVSVMMMRVPTRRRKARAIIPDVLGTVTQDLRVQIEAARDRLPAWRVEALLRDVDAAKEKYSREVPPEVLKRINSPWPSEDVFRIIGAMNWRIVTAPETPHGSGRFITSDNPTFYFDGLGVGTPNAEISVPLSTRFALLGSNQGRGGDTTYERCPPMSLREVNRRAIAGAERFVFSDRREPWLAPVAARSDPYQWRLNWA